MNIAAEHLRYVAGGKFGNSREIISDISLRIASGECLGVIGREGAGKTTLLNLVGGLIPPSGGRLLVDGVDMAADPVEAKGIRRRMGFTFQFPEEQFLSPSVGEEFSSLFRRRGVQEAQREYRRTIALRDAGLEGPAAQHRSPFSLSHGESRRLALALLAALRPEAAFLDEPTSGLDASGVACARGIVEGLLGGGSTVVIATHDIEFLAGVARRVVVLGEGRIAAEGDAASLLGDGALMGAHGYALPAPRPVRGASGGERDERDGGGRH
ncbi:MAG TPA: ABC transporter ATP-binding protein [Bacteroidota bacterium]|nr:ABC transporter ATP-binding protein [Bacteroidota bacterium]